MSSFKDHFSGHSSDYQKYRPVYPSDLFKYVSSICQKHEQALDVGTGNGQAALQLVNYFDQVVATDPSENQIKSAQPHDRISFSVARAEECPVESSSMDLLTVAQALHWFDLDLFFTEVNRVLKPGGVLAVWAYSLAKVSPEIDKIVELFYSDIVGEYWPFERKYVEQKYEDIDIPFQEIETPEFEIEIRYNLDDYLAYLNTWSAVKMYIADKGDNPIHLIEAEMRRAWSDEQKKKVISWPIHLRAGQV